MIPARKYKKEISTISRVKTAELPWMEMTMVAAWIRQLMAISRLPGHRLLLMDILGLSFRTHQSVSRSQ